MSNSPLPADQVAAADAVPMPDIMQRLNNRTPKEWLVACHNVCRRMQRYQRCPLWSFISDITGHGCTYSIDICKRFGWDPHAWVHRKLS